MNCCFFQSDILQLYQNAEDILGVYERGMSRMEIPPCVQEMGCIHSYLYFIIISRKHNCGRVCEEAGTLDGRRRWCNNVDIGLHCDKTNIFID